MCVNVTVDYVFSLSLTAFLILFSMSMPSDGFFRFHFFIFIAELMLRYTLFNKKQDNSNKTTWLKLLENERLSINKKYNNTWSIIKIMNQKANASEINEIKQSRLKYLTDITSNNRIINHSKLSTKTIKRINRQLWTKLRNAICIEDTMEVKQKYRYR